MYQRHRDKGLFVMSLVGQVGDGTTPTVEDVGDWADEFGLTTPVLIDTDEAIALALVGEDHRGIPHTEHLIGPGAQLLLRNTYMREADVLPYLE